MRILLLTGEHPAVRGLTGGIGSYVADGARALAHAGHDVHLLVCAPGLATADRAHDGSTLHVRGLVAVTRPARGRVARQLAASLSFWWHARRLGRFDAVEAPEFQGIAAGIAVRARSRLLICLQTPTALIAAHDPSVPAPARTNDWIERWTARRAGAVVSLSQLLVDELRGSGWLDPSTTVEIARPMVHPGDWSTVATTSTAASGHRLVGVGRLEARKGFDLLLDAAAALGDVAGVSVELVGEPVGDQAERLEERARALGVDLRLAGRVDRADLPAVLAHASVVVLPSRFDSFNLAGLEALACGVPVVTSDRVGLGELADGTDAVTVVPRDAEAFAAAIRPLLLDDARRTRAAADARAVAERCSPEAYAADRTARYERLQASR
jgi:glycosyltransferase involved in cell wall biosynthesis